MDKNWFRCTCGHEQCTSWVWYHRPIDVTGLKLPHLHYDSSEGWSLRIYVNKRIVLENLKTKDLAKAKALALIVIAALGE